MIDLEHALSVFNDYVSHFDQDDANIHLKIVHTYEVIKVMAYLSDTLNLSYEDKQLSLLIGLLHDFGRFEQWKKYHSYVDYKTVDHALYSSQLLFDKGYIRKFIEEDIYDDIIKVAIEQHNKYQVDDGIDSKTLLFVHLIRDADKLDNFRVKETENIETLLFVSSEILNQQTITEQIYQDMLEHRLIKSQDRKTELDIWLSYMAFVYDLHFKQSFIFIKGNDYVDRCAKRVNPIDEQVNNQYQHIISCLNAYIDEKIGM